LLQESQAKTKEMEKLGQALEKKGKKIVCHNANMPLQPSGQL